MEQKQENLTAAQRLERAEGSIYTLDQALGGLAQTADITRHATRLLGRKIDAIVTLSENNLPINNTNINQTMEDQTIAEMNKTISDFKESGALVESPTITPDSFVVTRETNAETGKVTKKQIQFPFQDVSPEMQSILIGKEKGSIVRFDEQPFDVEILEIYRIVDTSASSQTPSGDLSNIEVPVAE